ncbi:MAG: hypothetical protein ACOC80_15920 [Petrotogales bacterium]
MNNLFVNPEKRIKIEIFVALVNGRLVANADKSIVEKEITDKDGKCNPEQIKAFHFSFKFPSYGDEVLISKGAVTTNAESELEIDPARVRYERFVKLLDSWDLVDGEGNPVPPTEDNIKNMNPTLAIAVINALEEKIS